MQATLASDWLLGVTIRAWLPVANPPQPQPPPRSISIEVGRRPANADGTAGAYSRFLLAHVDPAAALSSSQMWPGSLPLFVCNAGTWTAPGRLNCTACSAGHFSDACGGTACPACDAATYSSAPGQTACAVCAAGFACPGGSGQEACPPGLYSYGSASACSVCPATQYCPGQAAPVDCPPGTSNHLTGQSACLECSPGNYSANTAVAACTACAAGSFVSAVGATACAICAAGKYSAVSAAMTCAPCPQDQYQALAGATECAHCPPNTGALLAMGLCTGACGGSAAPDDCVCKAGFTAFGQAGAASGCAQIRLESALVGQISSCAAAPNLLTVTFSANAALTTAVQEVVILAAGSGYVPGKVSVQEPGGRYFNATFAVNQAGGVSGVAISVPGRGFSGHPESVKLFYANGCAVNSSECDTTEQEGTISQIIVASAGVGYVPGVVAVKGGGGGDGLEATFETNQCDALVDAQCASSFGAVTGVTFATAASHGHGYTVAPQLSLVYAQSVRCDNGSDTPAPAPPPGCLQDGTITTLWLTGTRIAGCNTQTRIYGVGGGGLGFEALVTAVSPFGSILDTGITVLNHGVGYTSTPVVQVVGPSTCECNGNASSAPGAFSPCLQLILARGALLVASLASGAALSAVTGSRLIIEGLPSAVMSTSQVPVWSIPAVSISAHTTQTLGVLSDGSLLSWGKSETIQTDSSVMVWRCGFKSRYYRFVTLAVRDGGHSVHLSEIELFASGRKISVVQASNPGGSNPLGFSSSKAGKMFDDVIWFAMLSKLGKSKIYIVF